MKKILFAYFVIVVCFTASISAQIPTSTLLQISKAEDELRYGKILEDVMKSPNSKIRSRAALAAGRIGNEAAIPTLIDLLENDRDASVRATAAFALGEIESIKAAEAILEVLKNKETPDTVRARAIEAAGKIAAANVKEAKAKTLGEAILDTLDFEDRREAKQSEEVILLGLTAVLRARPVESDFVTAKFLTNLDPRIRADAANALARIRAKNADEKLRAMLLSDDSAIARANAARALGAAEDKDAFDLLLTAATTDDDSRVRVAAIRALASLKDARAADKLLERGKKLLTYYKKSKFANPIEKNELLEIATTLGRILPNTNDENAVKFLNEFRKSDKFESPETEIALARVAPKFYVDSIQNSPENFFSSDWRASSAVFQGLGEIANLGANKENDEIKSRTRLLLVRLISGWLTSDAKPDDKIRLAIPDLLRAFAAFKSENTSGLFLQLLDIEKDVLTRAAIADVLSEQPATKENVEALKKAFAESLVTDKFYNDAQLAILSALVKLDKKESFASLRLALNAPDYLVRRRAADLIRENDLTKDFSNVETQVGGVKPYNPKTGTKLGMITNRNADYIRAVSRKNGRTKAILTTEKGTFTINLLPEEAPLTVDNFIKLAKSGYFNNIAFHRVVPNFVIQGGDPRGDGNGGPGWEIRDEINTVPYERGAVGMALSGKNTGGSQWFVTHSPQPHLDGGYTVFGRVNENDMKIVDNITRGDKILSVKIVEGSLPKGVRILKK